MFHQGEIIDELQVILGSTWIQSYVGAGLMDYNKVKKKTALYSILHQAFN